MNNTTTTSAEPLVLTERIAAPPEAVFDFLVDREKIARWMGAVQADAAAGAPFHLTIGDNVAQGTYVHVERPRLVSFTWGWEHVAEVPPGSTTVTITLVADGAATLVELRHEGLPHGPADEHRGGWTRCLDRLPFEVAQEQVRADELELMLARERVAASRRAMPPGPIVENYEFAQAGSTVSLADLFTSPDRPLVLYHFMFGKKQEAACPMCSLFVDGWNAIAHHLAEKLDLAIVTAASVEANEALVAEHQWSNLRFLSAAQNSFKADIGGEDADGNQSPFFSVYEMTDEGPRLTSTGSAQLAADHWRGVDLLSPVWHFLDLTRAGRGDWMPSGM